LLRLLHNNWFFLGDLWWLLNLIVHRSPSLSWRWYLLLRLLVQIFSIIWFVFRLMNYLFNLSLRSLLLLRFLNDWGRTFLSLIVWLRGSDFWKWKRTLPEFNFLVKLIDHVLNVFEVFLRFPGGLIFWVAFPKDSILYISYNMRKGLPEFFLRLFPMIASTSYS
jgi:hypothetical protein